MKSHDLAAPVCHDIVPCDCSEGMCQFSCILLLFSILNLNGGGIKEVGQPLLLFRDERSKKKVVMGEEWIASKLTAGLGVEAPLVAQCMRSASEQV